MSGPKPADMLRQQSSSPTRPSGAGVHFAPQDSEIKDVREPLESDHLLGNKSSTLPTVASVLHRRAFTLEELRGVSPEVRKPRYESLDYEEVENTVYRSDNAASNSLDSMTHAGFKWLVCFLIGVITAITAFLVNFSVENISGFKFWATLTILDRGSVLGSFLAYASMNAVLVLAAVGVTLFVGPAAAGSGITDVKAYLNGIDVPGIFYVSTLLAKVFGSVCAVAGGLAVGKEGPFVHAGACIAAILSQGGSPGFQLPMLKYFWNDRDRADMVTAGSAAGVAAAFRSPVGGVLFALEEMSSWWRNNLMWMVFFTTAVVSVTVRVLMKMCSGNHCGFFGAGGFIYFEIQEGQEAYEVYELFPMMLLGVIGGLLGSSFIHLNARLAAWRRQHLSKYGMKGRLVEALAISGLTSLVSFTLPLIFACQRCPAAEAEVCPRRDNSHSGNFVAFGCTHDNQYSDLATLFFNTQDDAIRALFSSRTKREYTVPSLVLFVTAFYWLAVITYGVSCPTGLFVPSILCGAAYGRLVGIFVADMYPAQRIDEGTYALLGAASFLGGSMRLSMCTCVMLLELTNNLALLPLIMLVLLVSKAVGDGTGVKPIYEVQMEYKGLPYLEPCPDPVMRHISAKECCGKPPISFQRVERVHRLVEVLKSCTHNGFPVTHTSQDGETSLVGVMLRQHVLLLLQTRTAFQPTPHVIENASRVATAFNLSDFSKPISSPGLCIDDVELSPDDLNQYLDLGPYLNPSYYVVQDDASLSKVYTLFRTLGVRHLCVIPKAHDVVGIISREDLLQGTLEQRLARSGGQYDTDGTLATSAAPSFARPRRAVRGSASPLPTHSIQLQSGPSQSHLGSPFTRYESRFGAPDRRPGSAAGTSGWADPGGRPGRRNGVGDGGRPGAQSTGGVPHVARGLWGSGPGPDMASPAVSYKFSGGDREDSFSWDPLSPNASQQVYPPPGGPQNGSAGSSKSNGHAYDVQASFTRTLPNISEAGGPMPQLNNLASSMEGPKPASKTRRYQKVGQSSNTLMP